MVDCGFMRIKRSCGILAGSLLCAVLSAQAPSQPTAGVTSKDAPFIFKSGVNLVPVPVVVRDGKGHVVGNLGVEDFQLYDNGKLQMIFKFSVEKLGTDAAAPLPSPTQPVETARKRRSPGGCKPGRHR